MKLGDYFALGAIVFALSFLLIAIMTDPMSKARDDCQVVEEKEFFMSDGEKRIITVTVCGRY